MRQYKLSIKMIIINNNNNNNNNNIIIIIITIIKEKKTGGGGQFSLDGEREVERYFYFLFLSSLFSRIYENCTISFRRD